MSRLTAALREKSKEVQRLQTSFEAMKVTNIGLRRQLDGVAERNKSLEKQVSNIQSRMAALNVSEIYVISMHT